MRLCSPTMCGGGRVGGTPILMMSPSVRARVHVEKLIFLYYLGSGVCGTLVVSHLHNASTLVTYVEIEQY